VEAFEDDDAERAKEIVDSHTERAKLSDRLAFEQAHDPLHPNEER
jgi:(2Fe-2S) ferredoxin